MKHHGHHKPLNTKVKGLLKHMLNPLSIVTDQIHNKHIKEAVDPSQRFNHVNPIDRALESFIGKPEVVKKMHKYVTLSGRIAHNDPKTMAGQVHFAHEDFLRQYAEARMKDFHSKDAWHQYVKRGDFAKDSEAGVHELERQMGFDGFDDQSTEKFIPLIMAAGAALAKSPKVRTAVMKVGKGIASAVKSKKAKSAQVEKAQGQANKALVVADAITAGVPQNLISQAKTTEELKPLIDVYKTNPSTSSAPEPMVDNFLTKYKMPLLAGGAVLVIVMVLYFAKR